MALTPLSIIEEAEGLAYPHISENATARGPLLHQLSSLEKEVVDMIVSTSPNLLAEAGGVITIVLGTNPSGYALDTTKAYMTDTFRYVDAENTIIPIRIVPVAQFDDPPIHPAAMISAGSFYPCDPLGKNWAGSDARSWYPGEGETVTYSLVDEPALVTTLSQVLVSPDLARPYFVSSLALSIVLASDSMIPASQIAIQRLTASMMEMKERLPMLLAQRARVESSITPGVA